MTLGELLDRATDALGGSDTPRADAQLLLAHAIDRPRAWLIAHSGDAAPPAGEMRMHALVEERRRGVPIAYLLGSAGFYGREFVVNDAVLVPRPETEHLVERALEHLRAIGASIALDVGTGSGAIACSLAAEHPPLTVDATDSSETALAVARSNAQRLGVADRCRFLLGDLAAPVAGRRYDAIVANLPYVPSAQIAPEPDPVAFEPRLALDGGADGLDCYRRFVPSAPALLRPGGLLLLEAAPPLMTGLLAIVAAAFPRGESGIGFDYSRRERYVWVKAPLA